MMENQSRVRRWNGAAAALLLLFLSLLAVSCADRSGLAREARHIILLIGDGMGVESEIAASRYLYGSDFSLSFHRLPYRNDVATWDVTTYNVRAAAQGRPAYHPQAIEPSLGYDPQSGGRTPFPMGPEPPGAQAYLTSMATDSAAAATAWATGCKTESGRLAWLPDGGGPLKTLAELLREKKGFAIGVVSTVAFSHATPAAHVSHSPSRDRYAAIAAEILTATRPDVVIGAGHPGEPAFDFTYIGQDLYSDFKSGRYGDEYLFVEHAAGAPGGPRLLEAARRAAAGGKKLFGLFGGSHFGYPEPQQQPGAPRVTPAAGENPTLAQAVAAALTLLSHRPDGFFLMAEQGEIDWANHANDFRHMVGTVLDLQDAVEAAIDFVDRPGDALDWTNTLLVVTADHATGALRNRVRLGSGELPPQIAAPDGLYGRERFAYPGGEVAYATAGHTNELVRLYASGAGIDGLGKHEGRWYPGTRILDNTQLFHILLEAAGEQEPSCLRLK